MQNILYFYRSAQFFSVLYLSVEFFGSSFICWAAAATPFRGPFWFAACWFLSLCVCVRAARAVRAVRDAHFRSVPIKYKVPAIYTWIPTVKAAPAAAAAENWQQELQINVNILGTPFRAA